MFLIARATNAIALRMLVVLDECVRHHNISQRARIRVLAPALHVQVRMVQVARCATTYGAWNETVALHERVAVGTSTWRCA